MTTGEHDPPTIQIARPRTLTGIWPDLLAHTGRRWGRPWPVYAARLLFTALWHSGFHLALAHRLAAAARKLGLIPVAAIIDRLAYHWYHCIIPSTARIGGGLFIPHALGIVLNKHARLGEFVTLRQYTQIIDVQRPGQDALVGDHASFGAFATVIRGGTVGEHALVAAKALVTKHCPARHLARGIPAEFTPLRPGHQTYEGAWFE
ncbi:MAG: hypothetical protein AAGI30_03645 [Planctomycetota bacterium]